MCIRDRLNIVDVGTHGDVRKGQSIPHFDVGSGTGNDNVADVQTLRSKDKMCIRDSL